RKGRIKSLYNLREGFAEIIEAEVSDNSSILNAEISELELPSEIVVAAIIRDDQVIIPEPNHTIKAEDRIIILADANHIPEVEKMFSVQVDLF
ncbi:MAG: TrkA C-terminal domain-containing protein, partial [Pseudomonadota bacterium]